ncbi:MAG: hypothetical protein HKN87_13800 [Saprospiraceae bacterium]|nr:hypothetical protein [Saprospiraceae bacterium]
MLLEKIGKEMTIPEDSALDKRDYLDFLQRAHSLLAQFPQYLSAEEGVDVLELAHLIPAVKETMLAIYIGINDAVCNKGLVTPFLPRHSHNNVFVFDPNTFAGDTDIPSGTVDAKRTIRGFEPPNGTWQIDWTYVMISDPARTVESMWSEPGYVDMIPAKFEDFTMVGNHEKSQVCFFIDPSAFDHPVNKGRGYLRKARDRGDSLAGEFTIPDAMVGEVDELAPVILQQGEKLYVGRTDFRPCDHAWSNIHINNETHAVVNENSAVPLNLVIRKPPVRPDLRNTLIPPAGSADQTTDWFLRSQDLLRTPIKRGHISG